MRDPTGCRSENDETMRAGWLAGKRNPVSGDPLDIATLDLPPGSVVCCLQHAAHGVDPRTNGGSRRCLLLAYRKPDSDGKAQRPQAVPPVWQGLAQAGKLPNVLTELLRPAFDSSITVGA